MATTSTTPKVAYIYNESSDTWFPITGIANTAADYSWSGSHTFADVIEAKGGINNFQNPAARDSAIPSPQNGVVAFVAQDALGNTINQIQYYSTIASAWVNYSDANFLSKTGAYTLELKDSGKTISMDSATAVAITIPNNNLVAFPIGTRIEIIQTGAGEVSFSPASSVTIRSKSSYLKLNTQYSGAQLVKLDTNVWILIGDIKA